MKFKKLNIAIIITAFVGILAYAILSDGPENIWKLATTLNYGFFGIAALLIVIYWLFEAVSLHLAVKPYNKQQKFKNTVTTSMIGQLFNCVTPFASGGQPMQAYHLVKTGVPLGVASCSLMIKFIVYQCVLTVYSAVVLVAKWGMFSAKVSGFGYLVFIGFFVNFMVMALLLSVCFFKNGTARFLTGLIKLLAKIHILKHPEKTIQKLNHELTGFYKGFEQMKTNKVMGLKIALVTAVQLTAFFLIPYFICLALAPAGRSFDLGFAAMINMLSATACVTMISSFVPLPGAAGGAELSFHTFFSMFLPGNMISMAMLMWRFLTFYMPILVGMIFAVKFAGKKALDTLSIEGQETEEDEYELEQQEASGAGVSEK